MLCIADEDRSIVQGITVPNPVRAQPIVDMTDLDNVLHFMF